MEANELMIGDWVRVIPYNKNGRIYRIDYANGKGNEHVGVIDGDFDIGLLEPIPLTPEILEKNGFKYVKENQWIWEEKYHSNVDIIHIDDCISFCKEYPSKKNGGLQTGGWMQAISERGRVDIDSEYVHELQHALRLCGIEKEIEL